MEHDDKEERTLTAAVALSVKLWRPASDMMMFECGSEVERNIDSNKVSEMRCDLVDGPLFLEVDQYIYRPETRSTGSNDAPWGSLECLVMLGASCRRNVRFPPNAQRFPSILCGRMVLYGAGLYNQSHQRGVCANLRLTCGASCGVFVWTLLTA